MKIFEGDWDFDPAVFVVCSRAIGEPDLIMSRHEWAELNKFYRERGEPVLIESIRRHNL